MYLPVVITKYVGYRGVVELGFGVAKVEHVQQDFHSGGKYCLASMIYEQNLEWVQKCSVELKSFRRVILIQKVKKFGEYFYKNKVMQYDMIFHSGGGNEIPLCKYSTSTFYSVTIRK